MGTNYYAIKKKPRIVKVYDEIHLGKSSAGWKFAFQEQEQYHNFEGHGYLSDEQLDYVAKQMEWDNAENKNSIRIVMMHHHYLPTCYKEIIDVKRASSVVYDADRLMNWLVKYNVKLLLHGHKHKSFISEINYPKLPDADISYDNMHHVVVAGMGGTGATKVQNKFATIQNINLMLI